MKLPRTGAVRHFLVFTISVAAVAPRPAGGAQGPSQGPSTAQEEQADVVFQGERLFTLHGKLGAMTAVQRAEGIAERIDKAAKNVLVDPAAITVVEDELGSAISTEGVTFMLVLEADARKAGIARSLLAKSFALKIRSAIEKRREEFRLRNIGISLGEAAGATFLLIALFLIIGRLGPRISKILSEREKRILEVQKLGEHQLYHFLRRTLISAVRFSGWMGLAAIILSYVLFVLTILPWTAGLARTLWNWILTPLNTVATALIAYIPSLFFVVIISGVALFFLKILRLFFEEVESGAIVLPGFEQDWADSTFKVIRILILAFALVALFPYLPGSGSEAFKGISLALGLLFSISSSSAISNAFAGLVLTYTKAFRVGDRVQIGDTYGDVTEKTLLVTRVRTIKNVVITVPNSILISGQIQNFTQANSYGGFRIHTTVTIGYDAPWRTVHRLLFEAARKTPRIVEDPPPFVLQTALNDFYVSYEINGYTVDVRHSPEIYSQLHQNIQDEFNAGGVEIMSPHYSSLRDGNTVTIPEESRPLGYQPPAFRFSRN